MPSLPCLLRRALVPAAFLSFTLVPQAAHAQSFQGATASWKQLTATVSNGQVTAFTTGTGRLQTCSGVRVDDSNTDPVDVQYTGPAVAVVGGAFHLAGATKDDWGDPFTFTVDGTVSRDGREITGTITAGGDTVFEKACTGTWGFDAIVAPHASHLPPSRTFMPGAPTSAGLAPEVTFDYARGAVTHLSANVGLICAGGSVFAASVDTTAYGLDPVRVRKDGRFSVEGAVIDDYGVINHFKLTGRISGRTASGTLTSSRQTDSGSAGIVNCHATRHWKASMAAAAAPAASSTTPTAYFDVVPFRYGRAGAWTYYLVVKLQGCSHASGVSITVAGGPTVHAACNGQARLGPLTPQRTYQVDVTALGKTRVPQPVASVYLPGDDGNWIKL
jgi:hypothetical protein